jgi:nitroimidazol reductase NimA-like FMN-containing flavoprotein (pyridoxamine 5'-phosphate oxidase superfamily)
MQIDRNGLEVLDPEQCRALLSSASVGRVGVTMGALPTILPVNFLFDGERILVRTGRGTKLAAALEGTVVAFEVDDFDPVDHSGWSVVVTGMAHVLDDPDDLDRLARAPIPRWAPEGDTHIVALSTEMISGRRIPKP